VVPPMRSRPRLAWTWPRLPLIAAGLALFLVGAGADRWLASWRDGDGSEATGESENDWRQAVAEYISLYSPDTLTAIPDDAAPRQGELTLVGSKLGAALPLEQISLPGLTLKRAQLLEYDKKPLAQLAYLDSKSGVVALCIYGDGHADSAATSERRAGLNIVHWSAHGRAFMLVGHAEMPELQRLAGLLSQKLTL
jgi:anti-sigma factor RsiW